ncbi:MAG: insulinase family protein [Anaerolineae bacterium]|nr:insulinase family protein [Anaerolineae bacterium]
MPDDTGGSSTPLHGFALIAAREIPELNTSARLWRHLQTGAELLSLENDDENKVFGISFFTPTPDSTGLPHIMEHSVLCGSRKYPVKEPFVELLKGSLQTFVNAMTFPDKTMYPLASQNLQDFYNLIDVYLDAVFYPNITPHTLQQEGWHYELDDPSAPLVYKGVVFNEMKGAYSNPNDLLNQHIQESLFPDTMYREDSGGDPQVIPQLTYEQFRRYHETYYHPSNARIFFCGDDPPEERLRLADTYLKDFAPKTIEQSIALQPRFAAPRRVTVPFAASDSAEAAGRQAQVTVNWALTEDKSPATLLALSILSHILIGTPASPLRKVLIDSGLGEDLAGSGLDLDLRQSTFSTGLRGTDTAQAHAIESLVISTLTDLAERGIDAEMIEASLNTTEFALRENNTGRMPRGIILGWRAMQSWLYGGDPLAALAFEAPLNAVKERLAGDPRLFESLIQSYLLDNPHRTTVILTPDLALEQRLEAEEQARLAAIRAGLSDSDLRRLADETRALKHIQETPDTPEALATIPRLALGDLDREQPRLPNEVRASAPARVLYHDLFTNGILYLDVGFDLHVLPQSLLPYAPLFGRALLEMGTAAEDYVSLARRIGRKTGGIEPDSFSHQARADGGAVVWQFLRGKATVAQTPELLAILRDVLLTARLDNRERFRQIVLEEKAAQEAGLVPAGHRVVRSRLQAHFSEADWAAEQMGGVSYLFFLRDLARRIDADWPAVQDALETLRRLLVTQGALLANVTLDAANWAGVEPQLAGFLGALPATPVAPQPWQPDFPDGHEGLVIPAQVNYVGKGANLYALGYKLHGSIIPITNLLQTTWLWERVRVHGGAYGGFCTFDRRSGLFSFLSYRDPNLRQTLETYDRAAGYLRDLALSDDELTKSIIGAIGALDTYLFPDAKGYLALQRHLAGDTHDDLQRLRDEVLATTLAHFHRFGETLAALNEAGTVVVLGSARAIAEENESGSGWLRVTPVL